MGRCAHNKCVMRWDGLYSLAQSHRDLPVLRLRADLQEMG